MLPFVSLCPREFHLSFAQGCLSFNIFQLSSVGGTKATSIDRTWTRLPFEEVTEMLAGSFKLKEPDKQRLLMLCRSLARHV